MRAPFLMLPLALILSAPLTAAAQEGPKVLFCSGDCAVVDAKGVRRPAPKGTVIPAGFRLVTGPGAYAQVKLSPDSAIGLGENANIALQRGHIVLDQGRIRLVGGEAFGKPITRPIELRTNDGVFTLRNADVEMKTTTGVAAPTLVKVNAGDALLGSTLLTRDAIQTVSTGAIRETPTVSLTEVALATKVATLDRTSGTTTLNFQTTSFPTKVDTFSRLDAFNTVNKLDTLSNLTKVTNVDSVSKQITSPEKILRQEVRSLDTGEVKLATDVFKERMTLISSGAVKESQIQQPVFISSEKNLIQQIDSGASKYQVICRPGSRC